jgi:hypothetical protein
MAAILSATDARAMRPVGPSDRLPRGQEKALLEHVIDLAFQRGDRWLQRFGVKPADRGRLSEPIFFHHVAKTGGTSFIKAMRAVTPRRLCRTEWGNLSLEFVDRLVAQGLRPGEFIYGHPGAGAVRPLRGRARFITLLREPCDQVISNYFWLRKDWRVPDHRAAKQLGFREFLLTHPYFTVFQAASLHLAIQEQPIARTEDLIDRLPLILSYLDEMDYVSMPEHAARLYGALVAEMGLADRPKFPHRRKTRLRPSHRAMLREQFQELQTHPSLAALFAVERAVYDKARAVSGRWAGTSSPVT